MTHRERKLTGWNGKIYNGYIYINNVKTSVNDLNKDNIINEIIFQAELEYFSMYNENMSEDEINKVSEMLNGWKDSQSNETMINIINDMAHRAATYIFNNK